MGFGKLMKKAGRKLSGKKKAPAQPLGLTDPLTDDLLKRSMGETEVDSVNTVERLKFKGELGDSGSKIGYFKAAADNELSYAAERSGIDGQNMSARAVASSRLDQALGTDVLSREHFATHGGKVGSVSAQGRGQELTTYINHDQGGGAFGRGKRLQQGDYRNANFQRGMSNLQTLDYLTGQVDRHGRNIMVDAEGNVTGIDNDLSFGTDNAFLTDPESAGHQTGLPAVMDRALAERIMEMNDEEFLSAIQGKEGDLQELSPESQRAAMDRLYVLRLHIMDLEEGGGLVDTWGDESFERGMAGGESYLSRHVQNVEEARGDWVDEIAGETDTKEYRDVRAARMKEVDRGRKQDGVAGLSRVVNSFKTRDFHGETKSAKKAAKRQAKADFRNSPGEVKRAEDVRGAIDQFIL